MNRVVAHHICKDFVNRKSNVRKHILKSPKQWITGLMEKKQVLDAISFNAKAGEIIGLVGKNSSGKTTLMKILSGIYTPTSGNIEINGTLTCYFDPHIGMFRQLNMREYVRLRCLLAGMTHREAKEKYDAIVAFAEIENLMHLSFNKQSSGIAQRLSFSVAVHRQPDILLLDEVLIAGDYHFKEKAVRMMQTLAKQGTTIIAASHENTLLQTLCTRCILLEGGTIAADGTPEIVLQRYTRPMPQ